MFFHCCLYIFLFYVGKKKKNGPNIICINIIQYNKLDKAAQFYVYKTKKNQSTSDLYSVLIDTHSPILGIMSGEMVVGHGGRWSQACRFGGSAPNLIVISLFFFAFKMPPGLFYIYSYSINGIPLCHLRFPSYVGFRLGTKRKISIELAVIAFYLLWTYPSMVCSQPLICFKWIVGVMVCHTCLLILSGIMLCIIAVFVNSRFPFRPASPVCLLYFALYPWNGRSIFGQGHHTAELDQ